jgi:hypothetical protein
LAQIPPKTVSGKAMKINKAEIVRMVVNGSALVDEWAIATELTHIKTPTTSAGKPPPANIMHRTQFFPFIFRYNRTDVYPPMKDVRQYKTTTPARRDPRLVVEMRPVRAKQRWQSVNIMSWLPIPIIAQKTPGFSGKRKTSP